MEARGRRRNGPSPRRSRPPLLMLPSIRPRRPSRAVVLAGARPRLPRRRRSRRSRRWARPTTRLACSAGRDRPRPGRNGQRRGLPPARRSAAAPTSTANGASVTVRVSDAFPDGSDRGRRWAEFFSTMPHGAELATVTITVVTAAELPASCQLGRARVLPPGRDHHRRRGARRRHARGGGEARVRPPRRGEQAQLSLAGARLGPEALGHRCPRLRRRDRRLGPPGRRGRTTTRRIRPRRGPRSTASSPSAPPGCPATPGRSSSAATSRTTRCSPRPVRTSCTRGRPRRPAGSAARSRRRGSDSGSARWRRRSTATSSVKLSMPAGPRHDVTLLAANGRTVLARWTAFTSTTRTITTTICGQRSVVLRVTRGNRAEPVLGRRDLGLGATAAACRRP